MSESTITYKGRVLEIPTLSHPNCEDNRCPKCLIEHIELGDFIVEHSDAIDSSSRNSCGTEIVFNWMLRNFGYDGAQTEHGWSTPETWDAENILGMLENPFGKRGEVTP